LTTGRIIAAQGRLNGIR